MAIRVIPDYARVLFPTKLPKAQDSTPLFVGNELDRVAKDDSAAIRSSIDEEFLRKTCVVSRFSFAGKNDWGKQ
jgi:hypothetical protein